MKRLPSALILLIALCLPSALSAVAATSNYGYADYVWIHPDGTVEGTEKFQRSGDVYTLTSDTSCNVGAEQGFMLVEKNSIVIDGAGHTIQGNGSGSAFYMRGAQNVTVQNFNINGFVNGINFYTVFPPPMTIDWPFKPGTLNNKIVNNNITTVFPNDTLNSGLVGWGIYVEFANNTFISGNIIASQNPQRGAFCSASSQNTTFLNNEFIGCNLDFSRISENTIVGNTVDGKLSCQVSNVTLVQVCGKPLDASMKP
jgi:putative cofactor-binding repeat protein